ncbi:MAG: YraN family protein [Rickettsiales bacterium]|nr:YraN family protein [Rickettsiales bacterium]
MKKNLPRRIYINALSQIKNFCPNSRRIHFRAAQEVIRRRLRFANLPKLNFSLANLAKSWAKGLICDSAIKKTYNFGIWAEKIVIIFLRLKGYQILAWRHKTYFGEIDIIAKRKKIIAIIEVKARRYKTDFEEVLRPSQIKRIKKATEFFISKNQKFQHQQIRFDFIAVNKFLIPKHYKNFF